jgi:hypothetical protein
VLPPNSHPSQGPGPIIPGSSAGWGIVALPYREGYREGYRALLFYGGSQIVAVGAASEPTILKGY